MNKTMSAFAVACLLLSAALGRAQTSADALALEQQQKWAEAAQAWKSVAAHNPNDAAAFANMGLDLARQQKYAAASAAYRQALKLNPKIPGLQLNLGLAEFKQGKFTSAITPFRAAQESDLKSMHAVRLIG